MEFYLIVAYSYGGRNEKLITLKQNFLAATRKFKLGEPFCPFPSNVTSNLSSICSVSHSPCPKNIDTITVLNGNSNLFELDISKQSCQTLSRSVPQNSNHKHYDNKILVMKEGTSTLSVFDLESKQFVGDMSLAQPYCSTYSGGQYSNYGRNVKIWETNLFYVVSGDHSLAIVDIFGLAKKIGKTKSSSIEKLAQEKLDGDFQDFDLVNWKLATITIKGEVAITRLSSADPKQIVLDKPYKTCKVTSNSEGAKFCSIAIATKHCLAVEHSSCFIRLHLVPLAKTGYPSKTNFIKNALVIEDQSLSGVHQIQVKTLKRVEYAFMMGVFRHLHVVAFFKDKLYKVIQCFDIHGNSPFFNSMELVGKHAVFGGQNCVIAIELTF
jgi:hypothetical protein